MPLFFEGSSSISHQSPSANKKLSLLKLSNELNPLIEPQYSQKLKPASLRRMNKPVKMGSYCAASLTEENEQTQGIIVGTGLGCINDTERFLSDTIEQKEGTLSPTAFMQSTHNSLAGQIALQQKNKAYNMTFVQGAISFEKALEDAQMQCELQPPSSLLVGAVDENTMQLEVLLDHLSSKLSVNKPFIGEGANFFKVGSKHQPSTIAELTYLDTSSKNESESVFLDRNQINTESFDWILNGGFDLNSNSNVLNFKEYCGEYYTATAFACHLALLAFQNLLANAPAAVGSVLILNKFGFYKSVITLENVKI